jgi:hypothetical protein
MHNLKVSFSVRMHFKEKNILNVPCQIVNYIHNFTFPFPIIQRHINTQMTFIFKFLMLQVSSILRIITNLFWATQIFKSHWTSCSFESVSCK